MKKFPLLLISLFLLLATLPLRAQKEVGITVQKGVPMISVALPKPIFTSSNPEVVKTGNYIFAVLKEDLAFSLVFSEVPDGFYSFIRPLDPNQIFYKDWESIGAKVLVTTQVKEGTAGEIIYEMGVYDVKTEKMIFGKKYSGRSSIARTISHKAADAMMTAFGEKPIFTSKISFISNRDGNKEVYMMDYDGYNQVRLTDNTYIEMIPAISPDKNRISYTSYRSGRPDLYIQDLTTGRTKLLARGGTNYGAKWSHDGSELTYTSSRSGNAEIYTADGSGDGSKQITFHGSIDSSPDFSPNRQEIAFISDRGGSPQLYVMNRDGSNIRKISFEGHYNDSPAWSPDGESLMFVSRIENQFNIYLYNLRDQTVRKLTEGGRNENPSWSPDGRHIVFSSTIQGTAQLYIMDYNGRRLKKLTQSGTNTTPYWSK